ncbi:MAG: hypothetical protein ACOYVK_20835 [Bacillota bacterium]
MMKKIAALGMAAVLMMGLGTAAMAEEKIQEEKTQIIAAKGIQTEVKKITGTVEELRDFDLVVKDEDGVTYTVPILPVKESEEFKALDLTKGDSITLEGHEPVMFGEGGVNIALSEEAAAGLPAEKKAFIVKMGEVAEGVDGEEIKMLKEGESAVISVIKTVDGQIVSEAIKLDKDQLFEKIKVDGQTVDFIKNGEEGIVENSVPAAAARVFKIGKTIDENTGEVKIEQLPDMEGMKPFMATKITAKGKTIDIHEIMRKQFEEMGEILIQKPEVDAQTGN